MKLKNNFPYDTDAYKLQHWLFKKENQNFLYEIGEARIGSKFSHTLFTGITPILIDDFVGRVVTPDLLKEAKQQYYFTYKTHYGFNEIMWQRIIDEYDGKLPLIIKSLPEGSVVQKGIPHFTIENDENLKFDVSPIVGHSETLLMHCWLPTAVATNAFFMKIDYYRQLINCGHSHEEALKLIQIGNHDFGFRGVSGKEEALRAGMAFLTVFDGSDTNIAQRGLNYYYNDNGETLKTIFATEHSIAQSFGPGEGEFLYVEHVIDILLKGDFFGSSIVIDTYDSDNFVENVFCSKRIQEKVALLKEAGKIIVLRPDSGNREMVTLRVLNALANTYGYTFTNEGYKILPNHIRVIYGDGNNRETTKTLRDFIILNKFTAANLVCGGGSGYLRELKRDDVHYAIKLSATKIDDKIINMIKNPKTDATKKSKSGFVKVLLSGYADYSYIQSGSEYLSEAQFKGYVDNLQPIFKNGEYIPQNQNFAELRERHMFFFKNPHELHRFSVE